MSKVLIYTCDRCRAEERVLVERPEPSGGSEPRVSTSFRPCRFIVGSESARKPQRGSVDLCPKCVDYVRAVMEPLPPKKA